MLDFEFSPRPVLALRDRCYVLLADLQPMLGIQLLPAADITALLSSNGEALDSRSVAVWYDGSGVCYVRVASNPPSRVGVIDVPLWVGLDVQGGVAQLLQQA